MATDYIKTVQTRLTRKGTRLSKSQIREIYNEIVMTPLAPTEDELSVVMERLEQQYQAPSHDHAKDELTFTENPELPQQEEEEEMFQPTPPQSMEPAQPAQESKGDLTTSNGSTPSHLPEPSTAITQQQIQEAVEIQFGRENLETKAAILNYVAKDTFTTATELKDTLAKLRQMRLDILLKLITDHNQNSSSDRNLIERALVVAASTRDKENSDFFDSFNSFLRENKTSLGI
jgi:hypothetical protein